MNLRNQIEQTQAFKNLEPFKQKIYSKSETIKKLNEQLILARKQGYEEWKSEHNPCTTEDRIIKELLQNE